MSKQIINIRNDEKLDAQLVVLQDALNLDRTAVIKLAVATLCAQMRRAWLLDDKAPAED